MGRRIVGFLIGLLISALIFSVIAILSVGPRGPRDGSGAVEQVIVEPEVAVPAPVREAEPVEPVKEAPAEPLRPEPVKEEPPVIAEPEEPVSEKAPSVVTEPAPRPEPTPNEALLLKPAEPDGTASLKTAEALPEAEPEPQPAAPIPNPPVEIAQAEPEPAPAPEPQAAEEPLSVTEMPEMAEPEVPTREEAGASSEPAVKRPRLPIVSDETSRSAGIQFGRPKTSTLPTVTEPDATFEPAEPIALPLPEAPPPVSAKRLAAPKSAPPDRDKVAILTVESEESKAAPQKRRAIDTYGVLFDRGEKPTMSIILVDVGNAGVPLNEAATLDLPVTFALAVDRSDATLAAQRYFSSGHEVLALSPRSVELSLSGGQTEEQIADLLTAFFGIVPQSVGLLDVPEATLQNDRVLSGHVLAALHETGHGLVTYEQGLNVVLREADKAGVPAGLIYRALDQKGESPEAIKRHLDRAAAEAARNGHVLVIGSTRADTIEAIKSWAQSRAARNVALAPVSASIKGD